MIETPNVPYGLLRDRPHSTVAPGQMRVESGQLRAQIALIQGDTSLILVDRDVATGAPDRVAASLLRELQLGPTDGERGRGLESAMSAGLQVQVTGWRRGVLSVDVGGEVNPAPDRFPLAVAQIVLTATSAPGVRAVSFQHDDASVQVPLVDGSLTAQALTRQDYRNLLDPLLSPTTSSRGP